MVSGQSYLPLTDAELKQLEMQSGVTGLSSVDARRLLTEVRRLQEILGQLPPRDVVVAAKKAGLRLRHPDVPE
jgi:hypothetical protein